MEIQQEPENNGAVIGNGICAFIFGGLVVGAVVVIVIARYQRNSVFLLVNI